ncbi:hypothetical protein JCM3775_000916, partial [Rhodotorula graminis]
EQGITGNNARLNYSNRRPAPTPSTDATTTTTTTTTTTASTTAANSDDDDDTDDASTSTSVRLTAAAPDGAASSSSSVTASVPPSTDANAEAGPSTASSSTKKRKGKDTASATAKKHKKKKPDVDGDDFNLAGVPHSAPKKGRYENRLPGSIAVCAECGKKFTVSKYTASNPHGAGVLCAPCTTESIEDRASFPSASKAAAAAKKPPKKKAQRAELETLYTPVPTLQQTCLAVVGQYATDIEALGDIGLKNLDRVAKVLCKNRALTGDNLKLFLEVGHRELRLYDCTLVKDQDLAQISVFCPHLERLALNLCGRLDDDVIDAWRNGFKELRHLSLYAPYLVTANKWVEFLSQCGTDRPELETFELRMSSRFDDASLAALIAHSPSLVTLQLAELGRLTSASLAALHPLSAAAPGGHLASLDLARLGTPQGHVLEDDDVVALLSHVGTGLVSLTLDGNELLTEKVLVDGVKPYCGQLKKLSLADCVEVHTEGVEVLFGATPAPPTGEDKGGEAGEGAGAGAADGEAATDGEREREVEGAESAVGVDSDKTPGAALVEATPWSSPGLHTLNLHRLGSLSPLALRALLAHSGRTLRNLSLHSCDELDAPILSDDLARLAPDLEVVDLSFVRATDNFVVQALLGRCKKLRIVFLHGNNRVTADVPRKAGVQLRGLENALHSEIPPDMPW